MFGSTPETLFQDLAAGVPAISSSFVHSFRAYDNNLLRFIFATDKSKLFPSIAGIMPYKTGLKLNSRLLERVYDEFSTISCFADGIQLQTLNTPLIGNKQLSVPLLIEELRKVIRDFSSVDLKDEELANFCSLSLKDGESIPFKLLTLIKDYLATRMNIEIQDEQAYINPLLKDEKQYRTRADKKAEKAKPCFSVKLKIRSGVLGFEQTLHTGYAKVIESVSHKTAPLITKKLSADGYQWINILIQIFIPLRAGYPIMFLALVVTAERSLANVMHLLFKAINSGEVGRMHLRPSVARTLARAPQATHIKTYGSTDIHAFGLRENSNDYSYYDPDLLSFSQKAPESMPDFTQAMKDMHRDIEVPEGVSFKMEADLTLEEQQQRCLSGLRQMGFFESHYTNTQLLNLCVLVSQNIYNRLKTLGLLVKELFRENGCTLSGANPKKELQHSITPTSQGFIYRYHIYYTQVLLKAFPEDEGIDRDSISFKLPEHTPLISVFIEMIVPLSPGKQMQPISFTLMSYSDELKEYVEKVSAAIDKGMPDFYEKQFALEYEIVAARCRRKNQQQTPSQALVQDSGSASKRPRSADNQASTPTGDITSALKGLGIDPSRRLTRRYSLGNIYYSPGAASLSTPTSSHTARSEAVCFASSAGHSRSLPCSAEQPAPTSRVMTRKRSIEKSSSNSRVRALVFGSAQQNLSSSHRSGDLDGLESLDNDEDTLS